MTDKRVNPQVIVGVGLGKLNALCRNREQTSCHDIVVGILSNLEVRPELERRLATIRMWRQLVSDLEFEASSLVQLLIEKETSGDIRFASAVLYGNESKVDFDYTAELVFTHALRSIEGQPPHVMLGVVDLFWAMSVVGVPLDPFCARYFQDEEFVLALEAVRAGS